MSTKGPTPPTPPKNDTKSHETLKGSPPFRDCSHGNNYTIVVMVTGHVTKLFPVKL